jgi:hypothetical protein
MKPRISVFFTAVFLISVISVPLFSQDKTIISPYISFNYFKNSDDLRYLQTALTYSANRMEIPLPGMEISFYTGSDKKELLGTGITNEKGIATIDLSEIISLPKNDNGLFAFSTEFAGNDTIASGSSDLLIRDVRLEMILSEADSIKTISLSAFTSKNDKDVPVSGEAVNVYVTRMFSLLPVGEATLDENGTATLEFPSDLPGDAEGDITIISRFEEHPDFGNVERKVVAKWGIPKVNSAPVAHRALWTKTPPWWMIITLSILLTGVWGHYLFAIISLIRIKRDSKKNEELKNKSEKVKIAR